MSLCAGLGRFLTGIPQHKLGGLLRHVFEGINLLKLTLNVLLFLTFLLPDVTYNY